MPLNLEEIETSVGALVEKLDEESFIYDLLLVYDQPQASITRLKRGEYNRSKIAGEIVWKKKLAFKHETEADLHAAIDKLQNDATVAKQDPRFCVVTDYQTLLAVDTKTGDSLDTPIAELANHCDFFLPWAGMEKSQIQSESLADIKAAEKMGQIYELILAHNDVGTAEERHALNIFLSRLLFCFFAEDTGIFDEDQFTNAIASHTNEDGGDLQPYLQKLFAVLATEDRESFPAYLCSFPYVNGGLFCKDYPVPVLTRKSRQIIVDCGSLNWKAINPDIFGSMIQAVVHTGERREVGMHYTSVVNIMKVIEPLFLNELKEELEKAGQSKKKLDALLKRLYNLRIFDPACGSGNFLIIAYKELCRLEIEIFRRLGESGDQVQMDLFRSEIQLTQFYGIELDDFAHETAKLSLWLAEHQMNLEFKAVFGATRPTLPLRESGNIVCGNATRLDWEDVCPKEEGKTIFLLGNPPYAGSKVQTKDQKEDMKEVFAGLNNFKFLDYIACWFLIAARYISTDEKFAFVTTSSLNQGLQVEMLWPKMFALKREIFFAVAPFSWTNSARGNAGVTCSIVGARKTDDSKQKNLFARNRKRVVDNISPYLLAGNNVIVRKTLRPLNGLPPMGNGNPPREGGILILNREERDKLLDSQPASEKFIRELSGSSEFIRGHKRWCIWIADDEIEEALEIDPIRARVSRVKEFRESGGIIARNCAHVPHRFYMTNMPTKSQIIIPIVSAVRRNYIPTGFLKPNVVVVNSANTIFDAPVYVFAILNCRMHIAWVKTVAGRMRTDLRYAPAICWNTFPIPNGIEKSSESLERHTFQVLDQREAHPEKTMADLYDPDTMPESLREAHHQMDLAVERCYRKKPFSSDEERLEHLFKLYETMIAEEEAANA